MSALKTCHSFGLAAAGLALLASATALAQTNAADQGVAFRRAAALTRGINLSGWLASSGDYSATHASSYTNAQDLKLIHEMGFRCVRLGVDPAPLMKNGLLSPKNAAYLDLLDRAVDQALANDLAIMVTVFPNDDYKHALDTNGKAVDNFLLLWRVLAGRLASRDPEKVFFELINEPEVQDPYRWMGIQAKTVAAIRKMDAKHTIIATAARYSGLPDLLALDPVRDDNVIYNFHYYEPYPFTHQGASWGSSEWVYYKSIPYPATAETIHTALDRVPDDEARYQLYLYAEAGWNARSIAGRLAFAAAWARERHVPLICNEFGAYKDTADPASRARWINDVRAALEEQGIGWAMWDYRGNFGVVDRSATEIVPDAAILQALGLNAAAARVKLTQQ